MLTSEVHHVERWTIIIAPGDGDDPWPDLKEHEGSPITIRPTQITVIVDSETPGYLSAIRGNLVQRNGTTGRSWENIRYAPGQRPPEWAEEIIESRLHYHHLWGKASG